MEQQQRSLVFTAAVGLIILAIIVGSIYYLVKFIQSRVASSRQSPQASVETLVQATESPFGGSVQGEQAPGTPSAPSISRISPGTVPQTGNVGNPPADRKIYNAGNFQLVYPRNWGILNCTNSANFELDPLSPADSSVSCGTALKPITVLVDDITGCSGDNTKIGNVEVMKSKKVDADGYTAYQWCTQTDPVLNITHRVSRGGDRAVSPSDLSGQIEDMISRLTFVQGS